MVDEREVTVNDLVDAISQKEFNRAETIFNSVLGNKMDTALDAEKIAVAADVFDPPSEEEEVDMESELESAMEDDVEETEETSDEVEAVDEVAEEEVA
tara:strand:- start:5494 stop:5787 length:294 start_codon:yes stop_codon:yes gene_type:complete